MYLAQADVIGLRCMAAEIPQWVSIDEHKVLEQQLPEELQSATDVLMELVSRDQEEKTIPCSRGSNTCNRGSNCYHTRVCPAHRGWCGCPSWEECCDNPRNYRH
jgi:hypothetical protein